MLPYILGRLLHLVPVLLLVSAEVFFVFHVVPGDVATMRLGEYATPEALSNLRAALGTDQPIHLQYLTWLSRAVQGDLGVSYTNNQPVMALILRALPATAELALLSIALSLVLSLPLGMLAVAARGTALALLIRVCSLVGYCMPRYWLAVLLVAAFAVQLSWLPASGYVSFFEDPGKNLQHLALPVISVAVTLAAVEIRVLRGSLLETITQDYIRTAHAKGLSARDVFVTHALKNSLIPFVTIVGIQLGHLLGGLVVIEQIFAWPGIGWLMIGAITDRDYDLVEGCVLFVAFAFVLISLAVDVAYAYLDPRIRYA